MKHITIGKATVLFQAPAQPIELDTTEYLSKIKEYVANVANKYTFELDTPKTRASLAQNLADSLQASIPSCTLRNVEIRDDGTIVANISFTPTQPSPSIDLQKLSDLRDMGIPTPTNAWWTPAGLGRQTGKTATASEFYKQWLSEVMNNDTDK